MKILLSSLMLLGGLNLIVARSFYWNSHAYMSSDWWKNYDNYDYDTEIEKDSSEESKKTLIPSVIDDDVYNGNEDDVIEDLFSSLFHTRDLTTKSEEATDKSDEIPNNAPSYSADSNDSDENKANDDDVEQFAVSQVNEPEVTQSSEEKQDEDSNEVSPVVETMDEERSSEEKKDSDMEGVDISEKDMEELATLIITLSAIDDLIQIAHQTPDYTDEADNDELKAKEVDEFLNFFSSILDKIQEEDGDDNATPKHDSDEDKDDDANSDEVSTTTPKNDSDEDNDDNDDTADDDDDDTTAKPDSDEDDKNDSSSNENETPVILHTFNGLDHEQNLNNHKYEILDSSASEAFEPTTAPYIFEGRSIAFSGLDGDNVIQEYVGLRQTLDTEQEALQVNEQNLDKDFYAIISNNYNNESINKFEKDFFAVNENLDRIKRNINAMQNLNSKLYFHKLLQNAIKDVQRK